MGDYLKAIQKAAMAEVVKPTYDGWFRSICRWYSRTFYTPLHIVESELPKEMILQHYFEYNYGEMEEEERQKQIVKLLETPEEARIREEREEEEEELFNIIAEEEAKKQQADFDAKKQSLKLKNDKVLTETREVPELPPIKISFEENLDFEGIPDVDYIPPPKK